MKHSNAGPNAKTASQARVPVASARIATLRDEINEQLETLMPKENRHPVNLHTAMRYSLLSGGKRVRSLLCVLVSEAAQGRGRDFALNAGCAIEMVHAASLIVDDLPCMDDAETRRGRPAAHIRFGEATSILAAFGLLNRAFGVLGESAAIPGLAGSAVQVMSEAIGSDGMIAGQEIDLNERARLNDIANIETLNWLKTGSLFVAAGHIGALAAELDQARTEGVKKFARHVGLAFQTADDLIDQICDARTAGKDVRQDDDKPTIYAIAGEPAARASCSEHIGIALTSLETSGLPTDGFVELVDSIFGQAA